MFDPETKTWCHNHVGYGELIFQYHMQLLISLSNNLDIGDIQKIPGYCSASRTLSALVTIIFDFNLKVRRDRENLIWFNKNDKHCLLSL